MALLEGLKKSAEPDAEEHERRVKSIEKVKRPSKDPLFGARGPLLKMWKSKR